MLKVKSFIYNSEEINPFIFSKMFCYLRGITTFRMCRMNLNYLFTTLHISVTVLQYCNQYRNQFGTYYVILFHHTAHISWRFYTLLPWQNCSIKHCLDFSGKQPAIYYNAYAACIHIHYCLKPGIHLYS